MANTTIRTMGYTGATEEMVWTQGDNVPVSAYLWGGGGGGGGSDSGRGGYGSGGGFSLVNFTVNEGDSIKVAVGGGGGGGLNSVRGQGGGQPGGSYSLSPVFNTRTTSTSPATYPQFNSRYCTFLNANGVWENPTSAAIFDRTWTVNFPTTGDYNFTMSVDNIAELYIDGTVVFYCDNYTTTFEQIFNLSSGNHTIRILAQNTGGPGAVALTIVGNESYGGGRGGNAGTSGYSGGGGAGGGATVVLLNDSVIAVAGGGGGGGGGGRGPVGADAPGVRGQAATNITAGQNGTNKNGDGGGAGGGGGGYGGGNGGESPGGDIGGLSGAYGGSYSLSGTALNSETVDPAGSAYDYYSSYTGRGGSPTSNGATGGVTFVFTLHGTYVDIPDAGFTPVTNTYIKVDNSWNLVRVAYIKINGVWTALRGAFAPVFNSYVSLFGSNPRNADGDSGGGGGGGCKIICTKLHEFGYLSDEIYEADERFGQYLRDNDPYAYYGYVKWASVVVDWMERDGPQCMFWIRDKEQRNQAQRNMAINWARRIATPWAEHMAYIMGVGEKDNRAGRLIMKTGMWVSRMIGKYTKTTEPSKSVALGYVMWATFGVFWLLAGVK